MSALSISSISSLLSFSTASICSAVIGPSFIGSSSDTLIFPMKHNVGHQRRRAVCAVRAAKRRTGCACCALTRMFINATRLVPPVPVAALKRIPLLPVDKTLTELPATFDARKLKNCYELQLPGDTFRYDRRRSCSRPSRCTRLSHPYMI